MLDGWWLEGHIEGITGWSIGGTDIPADPARANGADAPDLYAKLDAIVPLYRGDRGRWLSVMKHTIALNASYFNTHRMVQQYAINAYL